MARPITESLEYFPLDVDFFDQPKLLLVEEDRGMTGGYIAIRLYCWIYRQGYYTQWSNDMSAVFARRIGHQITSETVNQVVNSMIDRGLFSKALYDKFNILTSKGVQKRWIKIITQAKRKADIIPEYNLLNSERQQFNLPMNRELLPKLEAETPINDTDSAINTEETSPKQEVSTQSKVKESKEKKSKKDKVVFDPLKTTLPYSSSDFVSAWSDWVNHRNSKKNKLTEEAVRRQLKVLESCGEVEAIRCIDKSIMGNWSGFFPPEKKGDPEITPIAKRKPLNWRPALT